jgi:DNA mismatch repair protein MutS
MDLSSATPMLRQYHELKKQYPGAFLFFRCGDFYEMFYDDAVAGSRELEITLTARNKERGNPIPMCGVPHHAVAGYIAKLVRKGYRVAVCEQTEEASKTKKLIRREVARVITPGTAIDPQLIESKESVFLAALCGTASSYGAAFLELSTGEFHATETTGTEAWARIRADIESYGPRELLFPASMELLVKEAFTGPAHTSPLPLDSDKEPSNVVLFSRLSPQIGSITLTALDDWQWQTEDCANLLKEQFGAKELTGYGLGDKPQATRAAGACLRYARETQRAAAEHISDISYFEAQDFLVLDSVTLRNLELVESQGGDKARSLFNVIDETVTSMGARTLKSWLLRPSIKRGEIEARLSAVEELCNQIKRDRLRALLKEVADLERLVGRIHLGTANPRDLLALSRSLVQTPAIRKTLEDCSSSLLQILCESIDELPQVRALVARAISDEPPLNVSDGGVIRDGFDTELDELRSVSRNAKQTIAALEERERARTGIASLRVRYNNVFGYFIEVSKANASRVPSDYERRQTLTNAERYTTPELKEWEQKVLGAEGRIIEIETQLFSEVRAAVAKETKQLQVTARALATLDALCSLAETATRRRYSRPALHDGDEIEIKEGRHPIVEVFNTEPFVPNDLYMNNNTDRLLVITGANMNGKSCFLRQTAIIQLLAQMGSFVPAKSARLPITDRIWTRVGASDDVASGRSTFMVEMTETAMILHNASPRSLILLDEIGRGTSTFDGLSIAWAVAEYLHNSPQNAAKTLFATHYHELTELAERLPGARNYQVLATEREGEVVFLHKLSEGRASKSYGIEVARLAGLPPDVLARAREVLERLERYELDVFSEEPPQAKTETQSQASWDDWAKDDAGLNAATKRASRKKIALQASLFQSANEQLLDELRDAKIGALSPDEAKTLLEEIQKRIV